MFEPLSACYSERQFIWNKVQLFEEEAQETVSTYEWKICKKQLQTQKTAQGHITERITKPTEEVSQTKEKGMQVDHVVLFSHRSGGKPPNALRQ